jgi:hypothetical protein
MRGAVPPPAKYVFMACCLVKQRDFTFTVIIFYAFIISSTHSLLLDLITLTMFGEEYEV